MTKHHILFLLFATAGITHAYAESGIDCLEMAHGFEQHYFGFPEFDDDTVEQLVTWRASCAAAPPEGKGNVIALCHARLADGGYVFYWRKAAVEAESSGYEICDY